MSAKTAPARRAAFMAAVAETGNQTIAAERARVSRSWVTLHRSTDPAFRAELDAAIAAARERLATGRTGGGDMSPAAGWGSVREALAILGLHRNRVHGLGGRRPGAWKRPRTLDEMRPGILRKLEIIEAMRIAGETADPAADKRALARGARIVRGP